MSWWTADRKFYALQFLLSAGLSPYGAAGLVSRWANVEAPNGPASRGGYLNRAWGIAQWLGPRLPPINGNPSFDAQLAYVVRELNSTEIPAANALRNANSIQSGAVAATMYERAGNYNKGRWAGTNQDDYTARTAAGMPSILSLLRQRSGVIITQPTATQASGVPLPREVNLDSNGGVNLTNDEAGILGIDLGVSAGTLLLIGASILGVYLISR